MLTCVYVFVLCLSLWTDYLCCPEENIYNISFSRFKIRDMESGAVILDFKKHCPTGMCAQTQPQTHTVCVCVCGVCVCHHDLLPFMKLPKYFGRRSLFLFVQTVQSLCICIYKYFQKASSVRKQMKVHPSLQVI